MDKILFDNISKQSVELLKKESERILQEGLESQHNLIREESPFSNDVNGAFSGYEEFRILRDIGLKEAIVTRKALIRDIDFNLFISCKQKTNYELMREGYAPYLSDDENMCIVIHHIGQGYDAPFAELTTLEHSSFGNNRILHDKRSDSWRNDTDKLNAFNSEKALYWKKRAKNDISLVTKNKVKKLSQQTKRQKDIVLNIKDSIETIFSECSVNDLKYLSNLANSYLLIKQIGASTIEEFLIRLTDGEDDKLLCPRCHGKDLVFYGYQETTLEKKQRFKCKGCGAVFSLFNNTIVSGCNMSFIQWVNFIDCLYNGYSLEKTAKLCDISAQAAFENRLRLFYALKLLDQKVVLKGDIVIDEKYIQSSHKGNRSNQVGYELTRKARSRGGEAHTAGLSKEKVCVVCALDNNNNSVVRIAGLGAPTAKKLDIALKGCIDKRELNSLYSDASYAIHKFADINSYPIQQTTFSRKNKGITKNPWAHKYIQKINSYHSRLQKFISSFNGVSSELLGGYMYLFSWKERNRLNEPMDAYKELLEVMLTPGYYKSIEQIVSEKVIESAYDIETTAERPKNKIKNYKFAKKVYDRWAQGETMQQIANSLGYSKQYIHQTINNFRKKGFAYTTNFEKKQESKRISIQAWQDKLLQKTQKTFERNYALYTEKQNWGGTIDEFYAYATEKYGLSEQSVKNRISEVKAVLALRQEFFVNETYSYKTLKEIFEELYAEYNTLLTKEPGIKLVDCCDILAEKYGYTSHTVSTIISKMKNATMEWDSKNTKKIPELQRLNRDISVFIDFMNWSGPRKDFFKFVHDKYGISMMTTQKILQMNYMADPNRYEITKMY